MRIEKEGQYGKAIVIFPDAVEYGGSYETIMEWCPKKRLPIFTTLWLTVRNHTKKIVWHTAQIGVFGFSPSPESHILLIDAEVGTSGEKIYITLKEMRGIVFTSGIRILYAGEMQIL